MPVVAPDRETPDQDAAPGDEAVVAAPDEAEVPGVETAGAPATAPAAPAPAPRRRRRRRSILGRLTLGSVFVTLGVMALLDATGATTPAFRHYVLAAVLVVGIGLLVGTFVGRARGLIVLGLLLLPLLAASTAVTAPFTGGFGETVHEPTSVTDLEGPYRLIAGQLTLDLARLEPGEGETVTVEASVVAGHLVVIVPEGVGLDVTSHVGFGEIVLLGAVHDGVDVDRTLSRGGGAPLVLDLDVGFGQIELVAAARS